MLVFAGWHHGVNMTHDSPILFLDEKRQSAFLPKHSPKIVTSVGDISLLRAKFD